MDVLKKYIVAFSKLKVDRTHGAAPHKPILLLSILQAFQNELITDENIFLTPELVALFKTNWNLLVTSNHDCRISYPFYYLKSSGFWKLIPKSGFENINLMGSIMKSFSNLNAAIDHARIDSDLTLLMKDQKSNVILQEIILDKYFHYTRNYFKENLAEQLQLFDDIEKKILQEDPAIYRHEIEKLLEEQNEEEIFLRGSLFKREIPKIYNNTCCISGMRIDATSNISMVDACHIIPFRESYNDTISNGIALCPNLHRAFDRGLIGIDINYKVIISNNFNEDNSYYSIRIFENQQIILPKQKMFYPLMDNFNWHRNNIFK